MNFTFPEHCKIVNAFIGTSAGSTDTLDYINCANAKTVYVMMVLKMADTNPATLTMYRETADAGGGDTALGTNCPIWYSRSTASSDLLARQTDGVAMVTDTTGGHYFVGVMKIDPVILGAYPWLYGKLTSSGTHVTSITYIIESKYPADQPPTAIA